MDLLSLFPAWLLEHGVAFAIVLPLLMGAITAILPSRTLAWWTTFIVTLLVTVTSFGLVLQMVSEGTTVYSMGGWDPPHGISLVVDALSAPVLLLISAMAVLTVIYGMPGTVAEVEPKKPAPFYAAF